MTNEEIAIIADKTGLVPVGDLPRANPQKDVEDFLRRVAICVKQAAEAGHKECEFRVNGIPNTPLRVMVAAIEPLKTFGYAARVEKVPKIEGTWIGEDQSLVVSGWGD